MANMEEMIYTLGTSNRREEEFLKILRDKGIKNIVDVRRFPTSQFEHFRKENLEKILSKEGFKYFYLGDKLGGYRKGGYEKFMESEEFQKGIEKLEEIAREGPTVIICAERLFFRCHRRFIACALEGRGWKVVHL